MSLLHYLGITLVIIGVIIVNVFNGEKPDNNKKLSQINPQINPSPTAVAPVREKERVTFVIDGDTFTMKNGEKVRLIGIDAPEFGNQKTDCFGKEAQKIAKEILTNQNVELEKDTTDKDKYGRLLRYVYEDGIFINEFLVKEGYAKVMPIPPDLRYASQLQKAQKEAQTAKRGLWKTCSF